MRSQRLTWFLQVAHNAEIFIIKNFANRVESNKLKKGNVQRN